MDEFDRFHPLVNFVYFAVVIVFSMLTMHPVCLAVGIICSAAYAVIQKGWKAFGKEAAAAAPLLLTAALINPVFNHEGADILAYFPNGNPLTLEAIVYGIGAAAMLAAALCYFACFNRVMTSDKLVYLTGRLLPSLSLIISMTLRFVPRFKAQAGVISRSMRGVGHDAGGGIAGRAKYGIMVLSAMITWALENSVDTARSMRSRGYGLRGRTAYKIYHFERRDKTALVCILALTAVSALGMAKGCMYFSCYPAIRAARAEPLSFLVFGAYFVLCALPAAIDILEMIRWRAIESKN